MKVRIDQLYFGTRQRKDYGVEELEDLKNDLLTNGQITAITISEVPDFVRAAPDYLGEPWLLCAGGRRVMAASLAGWEEIEAFVRETPTEMEYRIWELHENLKRKAMSWQEEIDAKAEILRLRRLQDPDITASQVAAELGESPSTFSRDVETAKIVKETPSLKKAGSKHSALKAGKELRKHAATEIIRREAQLSNPMVEVCGPLEHRVVARDAIDFVRSLPSESIDLVLTDGPYGYSYWKLGQKSNKGDSHLAQYDDSPEATSNLYTSLLPELVRVVRASGWLVMFAGTETFFLLQEFSRKCCAVHAAYRREDATHCLAVSDPGSCRFLSPEPYPWIWHRRNSRNQPRHPHLHAKNVTELIFVCNMGRGQIVKQPCETLLAFDAEYGNTRIHANQKPQDLCQELIERLTFTGDSVLDCFMGSGNMLAAAAGAGRVPWGCDNNADLLPFALGRIRTNERPISKEDIAQSKERFRKALEGEAPPTALESEEPEELPGLFGSHGKPFIVERAPNIPGADTIMEQRLTGRI